MNWGYRILLVSIVFVAGMLSMVYVASRQTNDMFDTNYYQKELRYQAVINAKENFLSNGKQVKVMQLSKILSIAIPSKAGNNIDSGNVELLHLANKRYDITLKLLPGNDSIINIPLSKLEKGSYKLRIYWVNKKIDYCYEETIGVR